MIGFIDEIDGHYCVVIDTTLSMEPVRVQNYYKVTVMDVRGFPPKKNDVVRYSNGIWRGNGYDIGTDGKEPFKTITEQIPPPKTKLQTRWNEYNSCWEKYSKSKGWVIA